MKQSLEEFEQTDGSKEWLNNVGVNKPELEKEKWEMGELTLIRLLKEPKNT